MNKIKIKYIFQQNLRYANQRQNIIDLTHHGINQFCPK